MLHLWIGRAGAGKTARVLETIKKNRTRHGQILIVPEHVSHEAEVALCHALGDTASRNAEVLSLRNLSGRVLGEVGGLSDFTLDGGGKLLTMRMALQEVGSSLHVFNNPSRRAAFLEQLVALVDELYAYEIPPQELYAQVQDVPGQKGDKLRDVALLYAAYDARLRSGGRDARSRVQKLRDALPQASYLRGKDVYFDGFSYFKRRRGSSLRRLPRQRASLSLCWGIGLPRRSSKMHCGSGSAWCVWRSRRDAAVPWSLWSRRGTRPWPIWKNTFSVLRRPPERAAAIRCGCMRLPPPMPRWNMCPPRSGRCCAVGTDAGILP